MEVSRDFVRNFTFVAGPLVLFSYGFALSRIDDGAALWGGIPDSWITYLVPFMLLAAVGFLMYWWVALLRLDATVVDSFRWPWGGSDGNGATRLLMAYALFLIPSIFWIDSTIFHMNNSYTWTPFLVVGVLALASVGNVLLMLIAYGAWRDGIEGSGLMLTGSMLLGIQVIVNDLIMWSAKFPW